jgi:type VI secretion system protein ImpA
MASTVALDLEALLGETREAPPCGPNLEHDLLFFELEEAARGKAEQQIGEAVKPAEDPKWSKVIELAHGLLLRSKDLRIAVHLTRALTHTGGLPGLASGLGVVHGLLDRYWGNVHPSLDVDPSSDPTERLNALAPLTDPDAVIKDVRGLYLVSSRDHGQLQVRDVEIALGRLAPLRTGSASAGQPPLGQIHAQIAAAFATDRSVPAALGEARRHVVAIQNLVAERVGALRAIDLKPLAQCLENLIEACDAALGTGANDQAGAAGEGAAATAGAFAVSGEIRTREEAVRLLDLVCSYLERREPSNPAPLFIRRAQRLMTKNFVEIVKDLMPESLSNLEKLAGEAEKKK